MHCTHVAPAGTGQLAQREARAHRVFSATARRRVWFSAHEPKQREARARSAPKADAAYRRRLLVRSLRPVLRWRNELRLRVCSAVTARVGCLCRVATALPKLKICRRGVHAWCHPSRSARASSRSPSLTYCRQWSNWEASGRQYRRCSHVGQGCWVQRCVAYHVESRKCNALMTSRRHPSCSWHMHAKRT